MKTSTLKAGFILLMLTGFLCGCQKDLDSDTLITPNGFNIRLNFNAVVDSAQLQFDQPYRNAFNETYSLNVFKFYVCQVDLINTDLNVIYRLNNNYYLIDATDHNTTTISGTANANKYNRIAFTIGVDSIRNVSGAQTGALDPGKGMFWTWNSGYIMAKLEGNSPQSNQPGNKIEYHIGGFKEPQNVIKRITLSFPFSQTLEFLPGSTSTITVNADVNRWFNSPNDIRISADPVCTTPGVLAKKIADNYSNMFNIAGVANN